MKNILNIGKKSGKMLIFGGPYSNLEATQAVLKQMKTHSILAANTICTGDICAYCSDPFLTSEAIKKSTMYVVKGNCEESLGGSSDNCGCGFGDKAEACSSLSNVWYNYALKELTPKYKKWMRELPDLIQFEYAGKKILVCHGSPDVINEFMFESVSKEKKGAILKKYNCDIIIAGHTGIPYAQDLGDGKYWINAGAIGMPANDGTTQGFYMILDEVDGNVFIEFKRLESNYSLTAEKMRENNLSEEYAQNLETGLWPNMDILPEGGIERKRVGKRIDEKDLKIKINFF